MSREFCYKCCMCGEGIFYYSDLKDGEYRTINTDRGNHLVCKHHTPASVKKMWKRVPCSAKNKDGNNCRYDANNVKPYLCARHGGEKI